MVLVEDGDGVGVVEVVVPAPKGGTYALEGENSVALGTTPSASCIERVLLANLLVGGAGPLLRAQIMGVANEALPFNLGTCTIFLMAGTGA